MRPATLAPPPRRGGLPAALLLLLAACRPGPPSPPPLPDLPRPIIFAHRGGAGEAPESTLPAMLAAVAHDPAVAIELDVHRSRDGHIVVIHDPTVDRTTNGTGPVAALTLAELQALDAAQCATPGSGRGTAPRAVCRDPAQAGRFPLRGRGYHIPTLDEVLDHLPPGTLIGIEVKAPGFEEALATRLRASGRTRLVVGSADGAVAARLRTLLPRLPQYFPRWAGLRLVAGGRLTSGRLNRPTHQVLATPRAGFGLRVDTPGLLETAHRLGVLVAYFTINDEPELERLFRLGADAVITDYPARARAVLQRTRGSR